MPHFYFIVHDRWGEAPDDEGAELADTAAALAHATAGARSMMSDSIRRGELDLQAFVDVEDEDRKPVARLHFGEALTMHSS